jgi:hypothetical protein
VIRLTIKDLIWLYFWLLIFEGALRKWVVPQLSAPLLIIRDPVVLLIYIMALKEGKFPWNMWVVSLFLIGFMMFLVSLFNLESNIYVSFYGLRTNILHFPLCFVMASMIHKDQFAMIGQRIVQLLFPMGVLMGIQFLASPDAFINATAGGEGTQIGGTIGNIRPPGTFSFITGAAEYLALSSGVMLGLFMSKNFNISEKYFWGLMGLVIALSVSISRLALSYIAIVMAMMMIIVFLRPHFLNRIVALILVGAVIFLLMLNLDFMQRGLSSFSERINAAGDAEKESGGFMGRVLSDYISPFEMIDDVPALGNGLGLGTSAGAKLLTGDRVFLLAEGEWARVIMESGPIIGIAFIFWRILFALWLGIISLRTALYGYPIPLLIFGACNQLILIGQISRPTTLGFAVFGAGLCLASIRIAHEDYQKKLAELR